MVFEDRLYALGGSDGRAYLDTVEYFDKSSSSWKSAPPMLSKRAGPAIGLVSAQNDSFAMHFLDWL